MQIGIIGTGNVGSALARRLVNAGHEVMLGSRTAEKAAEVAAQTGARGGSQAEAANFGEIVVLSVPAKSVEELSRALPDMRGKIIMETVNDFETESAESTTTRIQALFPTALVVKAFNHVFAEVIASDPPRSPARLTVFIAGDDRAAKAAVAGLIETIGFDTLDIGSAQKAAYLDSLAHFIVDLGYGQNMGRYLAFKLVKVDES